MYPCYVRSNYGAKEEHGIQGCWVRGDGTIAGAASPFLLLIKRRDKEQLFSDTYKWLSLPFNLDCVLHSFIYRKFIHPQVDISSTKSEDNVEYLVSRLRAVGD
jgi:hypothetical protein